MFLMLVVGCQTVPDVPAEPKVAKPKCMTTKCIVHQARKEFRLACVKGYRRASMKRIHRVMPYDDPMWQREQCRKKAKRMVR